MMYSPEEIVNMLNDGPEHKEVKSGQTYCIRHEGRVMNVKVCWVEDDRICLVEYGPWYVLTPQEFAIAGHQRTVLLNDPPKYPS